MSRIDLPRPLDPAAITAGSGSPAEQFAERFADRSAIDRSVTSRAGAIVRAVGPV
ncbi:hypothetical protein [Halopenitus malekzadehii]|uniref:hypothetical protein n=1 Tax=Halopenitus malekzadehii TaxID=1267564 RepID=UPI001C433CE7|nr:hypothetical protein [Halopenitus malekzadehii]